MNTLHRSALVIAIAGTVPAPGRTEATATSLTAGVDERYVGSSTPAPAVTSRTDHGWTAVSPGKAASPC